LRLLGQSSDFAPCIVVSLLEGLEGCGCAASDSELRAEFRPVELEGGGALRKTWWLATGSEGILWKGFSSVAAFGKPQWCM
jgi:hypothetical protein